MSKFISTVTISLEEYNKLVKNNSLGTKYAELRSELSKFKVYPEIHDHDIVRYVRSTRPFYRIENEEFQSILLKYME